MSASVARAAFLGFALITATGGANPSAWANDLAEFNAAAERVESHNRVALGYLRTGNIDLASIELDRLRNAWTTLNDQFAGKWPAVFRDNNFSVKVRTDISLRLVTADMLLNSNHIDGARQSLTAIRKDFYDWRKSAGVEVLADCIYDANTAMDALMVYNEPGLDWSKADTASGITGKAAAYSGALDRCDAIADESVRKNPEFRRLIDGARASMKFIPQAIAEHDTNLLHRVLIELRSFDNLLAFRFG
jgi:hypothetical protein